MPKPSLAALPDPPVETPGGSSSASPRIGQRATTEVDEGEFAGVTARVDQIVAWPLYLLAHTRYQAYFAATEPDVELPALQAIVDLYVARARPVWSIEDLTGPVPAVAGEILLRVPVRLIQTLYVMWLATFPQATDDE